MYLFFLHTFVSILCLHSLCRCNCVRVCVPARLSLDVEMMITNNNDDKYVVVVNNVANNSNNNHDEDDDD